MAANDSFTLQALANDLNFRQRIRVAVMTVAWQVLNEDPSPPAHAARATYARGVLNDLNGSSAFVASWLVSRPNVIGTNITVSLVAGVPVVATDATDAALQSQLATDWSLIAGA